MQIESSPAPETTADVRYKIAATLEERSRAFRLVYASYLRSGLGRPAAHQLRVTPYHLLPTTEIFVAEHQREVILTASLVMDGKLGLPMESVYPDEVAGLRRRGMFLGEVSCLADRRNQFNGFLPVFLRLSRLLVQYARHRGLDGLLLAVHPKHARFYRRFMDFRQFGQLKPYPSVRNRPAVALCLDFARVDRERPPNYETFFGVHLPEAHLQPQPMPPGQRAYFGHMIDDTFRPVPLEETAASPTPGVPATMIAVT